MRTKMNILFDDLCLFYHVADYRSFTKAAQSMGVAQARATRAIARLEELFGSTLMYNDRRTVVLTRKGEHVFALARTMMEQVNKCHRDVDMENHHMKGPIVLAAPSGFGGYWLMPHLRIFLKQNPEILMNFKIDHYDDVNLMLGTADIEIVSAKPQPRDDLECQLLCEYPFHIYASEEYLKEHGIPERVADLDQHKIIAWREDIHECVDMELFNTLLTLGRDEQKPRPVSMYIDDDTNLLSSVHNGMGLAFLPPFLGEAFPGLTRVHLEGEDQLFAKKRHKKYIIHHKALNESARHRLVIDIIKNAGQTLNNPAF